LRTRFFFFLSPSAAGAFLTAFLAGAFPAGAFEAGALPAVEAGFFCLERKAKSQRVLSVVSRARRRTSAVVDLGAIVDRERLGDKVE
jgi:hypothetical protein